MLKFIFLLFPLYIFSQVGIGTTSPTSALEVNGASTNTTAFNAGSSTSIDFSKSNLVYTNANPGNTFTLNNIKDGGTYSLLVKGTLTGVTTFVSSGFIFNAINNKSTVNGKETIYTFVVFGNTVYYYMVSGF